MGGSSRMALVKSTRRRRKDDPRRNGDSPTRGPAPSIWQADDRQTGRDRRANRSMPPGSASVVTNNWNEHRNDAFARAPWKWIDRLDPATPGWVRIKDSNGIRPAESANITRHELPASWASTRAWTSVSADAPALSSATGRDGSRSIRQIRDRGADDDSARTRDGPDLVGRRFNRGQPAPWSARTWWRKTPTSVPSTRLPPTMARASPGASGRLPEILRQVRPPLVDSRPRPRRHRGSTDASSRCRRQQGVGGFAGSTVKPATKRLGRTGEVIRQLPP